MRVRILGFLLAIFLWGCGSNKDVLETTRPKAMGYNSLMDKYVSNSFSNTKIETIKISSKAFFKSGNTSTKLGLDFRVLKGKAIWMSINFFGIPVAKLLVEPNRVQYYNKTNNSFFDGSLKLIQNFIGFGLDYQTLENILLGDLMYPVNKKAFTSSTLRDNYVVFGTTQMDYFKEVYIYPNFKIKSQSISDTKGKHSFSALYKEFQDFDKNRVSEDKEEGNKIKFPKDIILKGKNDEKEMLISLVYNKVEFDKKLSFPYKVPKECKKEITFETQE